MGHIRLRDHLIDEIERTSRVAVARRLGVGYRALRGYLAGRTKYRIEALIESRAAELGWPPADGEDDR